MDKSSKLDFFILNLRKNLFYPQDSRDLQNIILG